MELIPQEIINQYKLHELEHNRYIYIQINKGMYSLSQAGCTAHDLLTKQVALRGYYPMVRTP
eukprot:15366399-Ditylum_brightwellii.AAC.1